MALNPEIAACTKSVLDAIPAFVFAVDGDVRIFEYNTAAAGLLEGDRGSVLLKRAGEALHCIHSSEVPEGCGHADACRDCVIRNAVTSAINGEKVVRKRVRFEYSSGGATSEIFAVVTASPFAFEGRQLVLLLLEDISELIAIQDIVSICMKCKKIQGSGDFWTALESYFKNNWGIDFSHGYCPECGEEERQKFRNGLKKHEKPGS